MIRLNSHPSGRHVRLRWQPERCLHTEPARSGSGADRRRYLQRGQDDGHDPRSCSGLVPTGTVGITVKTTTGVVKIRLSAKTLKSGKVTASLGKALPRGTYYVWVSYSGNANISSHAAVRAATLKVT